VRSGVSPGTNPGSTWGTQSKWEEPVLITILIIVVLVLLAIYLFQRVR
jgi:hypothetical protein